MLDPEPLILDGRQCFIDAQGAYAGQVTPLGFFTCSWYGTAVQDERGSFAVVDPAMGLANAVGEVVQIAYQRRTVNVYVLGSQEQLGTDIGITRRSYMALGLLAVEPITVTVGSVS
jgi:hypothetical protein